MTNPECYRIRRHYEDAKKTREAAEQDLSSSSPNASPHPVRRARFETAKREQLAAHDRLLAHCDQCFLCKQQDKAI